MLPHTVYAYLSLCWECTQLYTPTMETKLLPPAPGLSNNWEPVGVASNQDTLRWQGRQQLAKSHSEVAGRCALSNKVRPGSGRDTEYVFLPNENNQEHFDGYTGLLLLKV